MRPELAVKHKIKALERRRALLDTLITFLQKHPDVAATTELHQFHSRTGLMYSDVAVIRPIWVKDKVALRLERYSENWEDYGDIDPFDTSKRTIHADISEMSDEQLDEIFDKLYKEAEDRVR